MLSYSEFWGKLSSAYPISKGKFHLPIAARLVELPYINQQEIFKNIKEIFSQLKKTCCNNEIQEKNLN